MLFRSIGYSLLKRFRLVVDYPDRVLWLDPIADYRDDRPLEYCQVGLQLERRDGAVIWNSRAQARLPVPAASRPIPERAMLQTD